VLDGSPVLAAALRPHGRAARRRRLARALALGAVIAAATALAWWSGASGWLLALGGVALLAAAPLGLDRYRNLGHAVTDGRLVTAHGSLVLRRAVLDSTAVIGWNLRSSWFQRRAGLVTLTATTAAGRQGYPVADVDAHEALAVVETVTPGLVDQFRSTR
jgi:putative membrane protein